MLGIVFDDAEGKPRPQIRGVPGGWNRIATILTHSLKPREWHGPELRLVQNADVRLRNRFVRIGGCPVIRVLCRTEERCAGAAIRIERGEGAINDDQGDASQRRRKLDQHFLCDLELRDFEHAPARVQAVGSPHDEIILGTHLSRE